MSIWRKAFPRPAAAARRSPRLLAGLALLLILAGCAGGAMRHESWPGMILHEETLYTANLERIQALNAETGKVYWSFPDDTSKSASSFYSTPVLAADHNSHGLLLVAGFKDRTVYALQLAESAAERPDQAWTFAEAGGQYVGSGTVSNDLFIIGNGDGKVYALRLDDGTLAWSFATRDRVWATPLVVEDTVYIGSLDHFLYALDVETGEERWKLELEGAIGATHVYLEGQLWVGDFASTLYRIDPESQSVTWTFEADSWVWATPLANGNTLYFQDVSGHVYALDASTTSFVWETPVKIDDVLRSKPALNADGSLLFVAGFEKGRVHAIDTASGKIRTAWGTEPSNPGRLPGDLLADATQLYTMPTLIEVRIQAFDLITGDLLWQQPDLQ